MPRDRQRQRADRNRRMMQLHQSGLDPKPELHPIYLKDLSQGMVNAIGTLDAEVARHFLLLQWDLQEGFRHAAMKVWPEPNDVPESLKDYFQQWYSVEMQLYHHLGWIDDKGEPTEKMDIADGTHCVPLDATLDTEPIELDTPLPHDGRMHTMSFGIETKDGQDHGGIVIAIKTPVPDVAASNATPRDILRQYCLAGHPKPKDGPVQPI